MWLQDLACISFQLFPRDFRLHLPDAGVALIVKRPPEGARHQ